MSGRNQSNTQFVTELMEYARTGAMVQCVVMTALEHYTAEVLANEKQIIADMRHSMISGEAWVAACREVAEALKARYAGGGER